jgi:hypothetical protein
MGPGLTVHDLAPDHVVLELREDLTAPGPALELHVVQDSETGQTIAWWEDECGAWLRLAPIGIA